MSRRPSRAQQAEAEARCLVVLTMTVERGVDGFTIDELHDRLLNCGLAEPRNVRMLAGLAISQLRVEFGDDVLVYVHRLRIYRSSATREEAIAWLARQLARIVQLTTRLAGYIDAAQHKYVELASDDTPGGRYFGDLGESLRRTQYDADRAARVVAELL